MMRARSRILLVRVGRMGDMAMFTASLQAVLETFPDAELHLVTSPEGKRLLGGYHPRLTRLEVYSRRLLQSASARRKVRRMLSENAYDRALVFETNPYYHDLFEGSARQLDVMRDPSGSHRVEHEIQLLERAGVWRGPPPRTSLPVSEEGRDAARRTLREVGIEESATLVGFHPTSGYLHRFRPGRRRMKHRAWPANSFAELARLLEAHGVESGSPLRIVIDVLPEERAYAERIRGAAGDLVTILGAAPDFERYKAFLERLDLLVTIDTGPMHVAAALGTSLVALFSDTNPAVIGPFMPEGRFITLHADQMPDPAAGMAAIPPSAVFSACATLLATA